MMKSYTKNERRGMLVLLSVALLITAGGFILRKCSGVVTEDEGKEVVRQIMITDSTDSNISGRRSLKEKNPPGKRRDGTKKRRNAEKSEYITPIRDILADTIAVY